MSPGAGSGTGPDAEGGTGPGPRGSTRPDAVAERIAVLLAARSARSVPEEHAEARAAVLLLLRPGPAGSPPPTAGPAAGGDAAGSDGCVGGAAGSGGRGGGGEPAASVPDAAAGGGASGRPNDSAPDAGGLPPELRGWEALFVLRAERDGDPWSGHVGLPGGYREAVDPDLAAAALRELREETGLELPRSRVLGRLDEIHPRSRRLPSVAVAPFVAWSPDPGPVREGPEVSDHFWAPLGELASPGRRSVLSFRRSGAFRAFPTVEYRGHTVWGLTYLIVRRFLGLLAAGGEPGSGAGPGGGRGGERDTAAGRTHTTAGEEGSWTTS